MIYDKKQGSLLNYIQMPLNVITPYGTYLGTRYDNDNAPEYILSDVRVKTYNVTDLVFSTISKDYIMRNEKPTSEMKDSAIGYGYEIAAVEEKYGYITVSSMRIDITNGYITKGEAKKILEKQLRNIGNVLEKFITQPLGQPQFDALLVYFFYEGVDTIETSPIIAMINSQLWFRITDEMQTNIKRANGRVDDQLAKRRIDIAKMWSYVPGYS